MTWLQNPVILALKLILLLQLIAKALTVACTLSLKLWKHIYYGIKQIFKVSTSRCMEIVILHDRMQ